MSRRSPISTLWGQLIFHMLTGGKRIARDDSSRSSVSRANSILAAFEMSLCCAIPVRQSLPTAFKKTA